MNSNDDGVITNIYIVKAVYDIDTRVYVENGKDEESSNWPPRKSSIGPCLDPIEYLPTSLTLHITLSMSR